MNLRFLMAQYIVLQEYFKIILYLYQLKNRFFTLTTQMYLWKSRGMSENTIENITKIDNTFAPTCIIIHYQL